MGAPQTRSQWRVPLADGDAVYVTSYPQEQVVVLTMDDHYARLTPDEARAYAKYLLRAADYTEIVKR